ncbi:hypothetical protein HG536_0G02390 [Torulaspora globosa]|uniref:Pre-mRNA-splicing factor 38 n=1 Tax=Torulaspora globosa TaxID=48254 RepID=A0A7G3ZLJ2_9SACH|nr:uncharacterized protein HG536_0G02390 [Torulaspora globosa]QLL34378.1 hypothetical protein HG536_0G02390 [Torulaspora globosa]
MSFEFHVESYLSSKQLNNQSVSLVIPRLARDRIHNVMYYKVNLHPVAMRGDTLKQLINIIVRDFGTLKDQSVNATHVLGGFEFKCILMKLVELRPTWDQLQVLLQEGESGFSNKYIVALVLTYLRIQYYYLQDESDLAKSIVGIFKMYICDYRKMKSVALDMDCWSPSQSVSVCIVHTDELVDWLVTRDEVWGFPLGKCQWCQGLDRDSSSSGESSSESDEED